MRELGAVRQLLFNVLKVNAVLLAALTNTDGTIRIYPYNAPEGRGYPFVIFTFETSINSFVFGNVEPIYTRPIYRVMAISDQSPTEADILSSAIHDALVAVPETDVTEQSQIYTAETPVLLNALEMVERSQTGNRHYYHSGGRYQVFLQRIT